MLLDSFLRESAKRFPEKVGVVCDQRRLTYREWDRAADALAAGFKAAGVGRGDRILVHLENGIEAVLSIFGALRADAVVVPINPTVKEDKLAYVLNDSGAKILISDWRAEAIVAAATHSASALKCVVMVGDASRSPGAAAPAYIPFETLLHGGEDNPVVPQNIDIDLAALIYTSGSTGRPKGVMLTHGNMVTAATSISRYLEMSSDDVVLNVLPLSFDYGLYQVLLTCMVGGRLVLERAFAYPRRLLDLMISEGVTGLPIVPMIAALLLRQNLSAHPLSTLRFISNTGAVLPPAHVAALRDGLPHVKIYKMYGLTECKRVSYLSPDQIDVRPDSVGKPMDNVEVFIVNEHGERHESGIGELVIRGSNVMQGYWNAPEATARVLKAGRYPGEFELHSGDMFRIDESGYMYFISRTDDVIKSRGQKVGPREVEDVLHAAPGVGEAMVVGVPDPVMGEAIKAYVTADQSCPLTEQDLLRHCATHLEDFMVPQSIDIVAALPRTQSGKIVRQFIPSNQATQH